MKEQVDEIARTQLLSVFNKAGIPKFLVAQCLCLIEGNLISQKETQLEDDFNRKGAGATSDLASDRASLRGRKAGLQSRI